MKKFILCLICLCCSMSLSFAQFVDKETLLQSEKNVQEIYSKLQTDLDHFHGLLGKKASKEEFKQWYINTRNSLHQLDLHQLKLQAYTIVHMHKNLSFLYENRESLLKSQDDQKKAAHIYQHKLEVEYKHWLSQKDNIGGHPKTQEQRVHGIYEYFVAAYSFSKIFVQDKKTLILNDGEKIKKSDGLKALLATINVPYNTITRNKNKTYHFNTPQTKSYDHMFAVLKIALGYHTQIEGSEIIQNIPKHPKTNKDVYLFLPTHNLTLGDTILVSELNFPHYILFCNIKNFAFYSSNNWFSHYERYKMSSFPEIIAMGSGYKNHRVKNGISASDKTLNSLKLNTSNTVINYPTGSVAIFGEIPPLSHNFSANLVQKIFDNHLKANIIPANFDAVPSFMRDIRNPRFEERNLHAKIHPPITAHDLKKILKFEELLSGPEISNYLSSLFYGYDPKNMLYAFLKDEKKVQEEIESLKRPDILGVYLRTLYIVNAQYKMLTLNEIERRVGLFNINL